MPLTATVATNGGPGGAISYSGARARQYSKLTRACQPWNRPDRSYWRQEVRAWALAFDETSAIALRMSERP